MPESPEANVKQCATCEAEIHERFQNQGGRGSAVSWWEHESDNTRFCRDQTVNKWFDVVPVGTDRTPQ
jgi:hypothetical protein